MIILTSSYCNTQVFSLVADVMNPAKELLNQKIQSSSLAGFDMTVNYVPAIMPIEHLSAYPASKRLYKAKRSFDLVPQLSHDLFLHGNWNDRVLEFLKPMEICSLQIERLDGTPDQSADFLRLLQEAIDEMQCHIIH